MAEYYPLISRAVAGLRAGTPDTRRAIYDRARQALVGQLRAMDPPIPEEAIEREITALDEAVARVESDIATSATPAKAPAPPPARPAPPVTRPPVPAAAGIAPTVRPPAPRAADAPAVAIAPRPSLPRPSLPRKDPLVAPARPALPPLRPSALRPSAPLIEAPSDAVARPEPHPPESKSPAEPRSNPDASSIPSPSTFPAAATLQVDPAEAVTPPAERTMSPASVAGSGPDPVLPEAPTERGRDDLSRPVAPRPVNTHRPNLRVWIVAIAALAAVIAIAFTAWRLRDNPQELARVPVAATSPEPVAGKLVERADSASGEADDKTAATAPVAASDDAASAPATGVATASAVVPAAATATAPDAPAVPVAYKAAILVDAPDEPQKVKTYVGTVVWRTETVSQGQDQPIGTAIRADIDIPDAKIQAVMQFRRNTEAQFPASHTIDLKFSPAPDSPLGSIKQISVPQMRRDDMPTGDPLSGVPVPITDNYFLVGLTRGDAESRNLDLIESRGWFDIPMLLANGKASKITFEKGASGEKIFSDVLQIWKLQPN